MQSGPGLSYDDGRLDWGLIRVGVSVNCDDDHVSGTEEISWWDLGGNKVYKIWAFLVVSLIEALIHWETIFIRRPRNLMIHSKQ